MKKDNELIAEYMEPCLWCHIKRKYTYHKDWNKLMEVVDRIRGDIQGNDGSIIDISIDIVTRCEIKIIKKFTLKKKIYYQDFDTIKAVYKTVVEYIKFTKS